MGIKVGRADKGPDAKIASYLVMAHRIRGATHYKFDEEDQFELERLFVELMFAAVLTFSHVHSLKNPPPGA